MSIAHLSRRPIWYIPCFAGQRSDDNPYGLHPRWNDPDPGAAVGWLLDEAANGYRHGATRFFMPRPMGTDGASYVSAASWMTIHAKKREVMAPALADLAKGRLGLPVEMIPMIGSRMHAADDIGGAVEGEADQGHLLGSATRDSQVTLAGWMSCGVRTIAIDNAAVSAGQQAHFVQLHRAFARYGMSLIGEAFPRGPDGTLNLAAARAMPWLADQPYVDAAKWLETVDPLTTRMYVWDLGRMTVKSATGYLDRGFSIITANPEVFRLADEVEANR